MIESREKVNWMVKESYKKQEKKNEVEYQKITFELTGGGEL